MVKGFKDFLLRGNIVDLAVAVVIGTAFVALVAAFTETFVNPLLARAGGASIGAGLGFQLGSAGNDSTFVDLGAFLTACIAFLITAAVVYFAVVLPMQRMASRFGAEEAPAAVPADVVLLTEIRDLLQRQRLPETGASAGHDDR